MPSIQIFWNISVTEFLTPYPGFWYLICLVLSGDFKQILILEKIKNWNKPFVLASRSLCYLLLDQGPY